MHNQLIASKREQSSRTGRLGGDIGDRANGIGVNSRQCRGHPQPRFEVASATIDANANPVGTLLLNGDAEQGIQTTGQFRE